MIKCPYCGEQRFKTTRGLSNHQRSSAKCAAKIMQKYGMIPDGCFPHDVMPLSDAIPTNSRNNEANENTSKRRKETEISFICNGANQSSIACGAARLTFDATEDNNFDFHMEDDMQPLMLDSDEELDVNENPIAPDCTIKSNFVEYVARANAQFANLTKVEQNAIALLHRLRKTKASLDTYESVMEWHLRATGSISEVQSIAQSNDYVSRPKLFKMLRKRYNLPEEKFNHTTEITLPHSQAQVKIVWHDAQTVIQSLLTDPRIDDDHYLFFDNNPLSPPPDKLKYVQDLNTGRAYTETYEQLITDSTKQILLPVIFYIDGANTGQFVDLPITAVKISLGIFSRKARDMDYCWRTLGYIPAHNKHVSRGERLMIDTGHLETVTQFPNAPHNGGGIANNDVSKAQDLHAILRVILKSYVKLQKTGFKWDLKYKNNVYEDIEFVMFTPFLKLDSDEAEKLCGKFTSRTGNVKMLCRYCECPTNQSDKPFVTHPPKTKEKIQALVANHDVEGLRQLSQHCIKNAMYKLRFGLHNNHHIHGACPMDMLHAILLGIFRYVRDCFFEQVGATSSLADDINAYARQYGELISRQSDRDLPKTRFSAGIRRGKLNAKDFPGILLCLAAALRCDKVRSELAQHRALFKEDGVLQDWQLLVETLLEWEQWLKSDKLPVKQVKLAQNKNRELMYLIKKVGRRTQGMGLKIIKFHAIIHLADDILNFGVPMEVDTGSNESAHKIEKTAARLTQKRKEQFDVQTSKRLEEVFLLDLAMEEIKGKCVWNYYQDKPQLSNQVEEIKPPFHAGQQFYVDFCEEKDKNIAYLCTRKRGNQEMKLEQDLVDFIAQLQIKVGQYCAKLYVSSNHHRMGHTFRASAHFREKVWRDWVMVDWGDEGVLPCHILGFVDLLCLPATTNISHGQMDPVTKGLYAIVECSVYDDVDFDEEASEIFVPITKEIGGLTGNFVSHRIFYLVDVESFVKPCAVIPNMGGPPNSYFRIRSREKWHKLFADWLKEPSQPPEYYASDEDVDEQAVQVNYQEPYESDASEGSFSD